MSSADLERVLRAFGKRRPFRPFFLEFHGGDRISVSYPEAIERNGDLFLHRSPDRAQRVFAATDVCQVIDPPPPAAAAGT